MKQAFMSVRKLRNNSKDDIWREPKYRNNGCLVAKLRIGEGQTTRTQVRRLQANGSRNGLLL